MSLLLGASGVGGQPRAPQFGEFNGAYQIEIRVGDAGVEVSGDWRAPPVAQDTAAFEFLLSPLIERPRLSVRCDGEAIGVGEMGAVEEGGDNRWTVELARTCPAGRPIDIRFSYALTDAVAPQLRASATEGFAGGFGELWYPQRSFAGRDTGRIVIDAPAAMQAVATGSLVSTRARGRRLRREFNVRTPAKLAFAYGPYLILDVAGDFPVRVMSRSEGIDAEAIRDRLGAIVGPLTTAFGPPPQNGMTVVEIDFRSQVLGSSEYGMLFVDTAEMQARQQDFAYWAHELAHQWWGVTLRPVSRSPGSAMLTEGLAQYGALVALEAAEAAASASSYRRSGARHSVAAYAEFVAQRPDDIALADFLPGDQSETVFAHRLAASKGALVLDLFAREFGRERFHVTLRSFLEEHNGGSATWAQLEERLVADFGSAARNFLDQWLHRPGLPQLDITWEQTRGGVTIQVRQISASYRLNLPVVLRTVAGAETHTLAVTQSEERFLLSSPQVIALAVDPDATIPMQTLHVRSIEGQ
jgi:hypothetical protein